MPAKAEVIYQIDSEIKNAAIKQFVNVKCAFKSCGKDAKMLFTLGYPNGRWNVYGVCKEHREEIRERHKDKISLEIDQAVFYY